MSLFFCNTMIEGQRSQFWIFFIFFIYFYIIFSKYILYINFDSLKYIKISIFLNTKKNNRKYSTEN